jgi:hypothetical protein
LIIISLIFDSETNPSWSQACVMNHTLISSLQQETKREVGH